MSTVTRKWIKAGVAAIVTGCSNSFLSALGVQGAQAIGINVETLSPKQLVATTVIGGLVGAFAYLKQSPVPPDETVFITKGKS